MGDTSDFEGSIITHGPWGAKSEGNKWVYMPRGFIQKITIVVKYESCIDSIAFQTYSSTKNEVKRSFFGGKGGKTTTDTICIHDTNEYLMSISGTYDRYYGSDATILRSICFMTNMNLYGPYGGHSSGTIFSHEVKDGVVVGFHGRASEYINSIGLYILPTSDPNSADGSKTMPELHSSMRMLTDAGPWGACGGTSWDDGVFSSIKQVRVHVGPPNVIYALQFGYQKRDGKSVLSQIHGGADGSEMKVVNFDEKEEYLTGISGFYGPVKGFDGLEAIASISFHTNKRTHGPYGEEKGGGYVYFSSTPFAGKIVGFHGRRNGFLSAIGVHVEYF